ncbi:MAG: hypothetical protein LBR85_05955 [Oscillospiraceae bacterium]|jgi:hypothetical protein|nr:hypothetical protein [Oscillospiraceae bacterium]
MPHTQISKAREQKQRENERFTWRVLAAFGMAAALMSIPITVSRRVTQGAFSQDTESGLRVGVMASLIAAVVCAVICALILSRKKRPVLGEVIGCAAGIFGLSALCFAFLLCFRQDGLMPLYLMLPAIALLYLLYFIYPREFSLMSIIDACGALGFWIMNWSLQGNGYAMPSAGRVWPSATTPVMLVFAFAVLLSVLFVFALRARKGILWKLRILPPNARYGALIVNCGMLILGLAACFVFGWMGAWVSLIACIIYLFITAIYYTSTLM